MMKATRKKCIYIYEIHSISLEDVLKGVEQACKKL